MHTLEIASLFILAVSNLAKIAKQSTLNMHITEQQRSIAQYYQMARTEPIFRAFIYVYIYVDVSFTMYVLQMAVYSLGYYTDDGR
jgi:hypothetical protein